MAEEKVEDKQEEVKEEIVVEEEKQESKEDVSRETPEVKVEETATEEKKEEELDSYSKGVQARIKKLTEKYRQEERDKAEALRVSQQLLEENKKLQARVKNLDTGYVAEYGNRINSQSEAAKRMYKEAYEAGDSDKMVQAQEMLSQIAVDKQRYNTAKARVEQQAKVPAQRPEQQAQQPQPQAQPDPRAKEWASQNEWFGSDKIMTTAAFTLHNILTNEEGFDPKTEEYYSEIDKRIRAEFPQKFQTKKSTGGTQVASAGNSASRNTKTGRRTVKLSPSQVAIAKKLGVPLEQYAKYVKD
tara:strand:- start:3936 stop:4835 length:900 start_codon:yes stop_codon:yes gene_type:complete